MSSALRIIGDKPSVSTGGAGVTAKNFRGRAAIVTLGCAKNQVDSEVMLGVLTKAGFEIVDEVVRADVAIVNTCGFLQSAATESIDRILEIAELKSSGQLRQLIVAGCLVERYQGDLREALPEVDQFITTQNLLEIGDVALGQGKDFLSAGERPYFLYDDHTPRVLSTRSHTAYVKVGEGCDRPCTFCIIPRIRGAMRSRKVESVVNEVKSLVDAGVREVNLVAQDLTSFGKDHGSGDLVKLLTALDQETTIDWIRLLYAYPVGTDQRLLESIVSLPSVCEYLDLPLQHVSEKILKPMRRPLGKLSPRNLVEFIRSDAPEVHLRTTFIVGFPGEQESDIRELEDFVSEGHFTNVGVFTYSPEEGTPSFGLSGHLPDEERQERRQRIMLAQQKVVERHNESVEGQVLEVLIEGTHEETELLLSGRTRFQAPEVDGTVIINEIDEALREVMPGMIGSVEITESAGYDLIGRLINVKHHAGH